MPWVSRDQLKLRREVLELPDGDTTAIDWAEDGDALPQTAPLLVILHGLEGSAESSYAQSMMRVAIENGWRSCVLHFRDYAHGHRSRHDPCGSGTGNWHAP